MAGGDKQDLTTKQAVQMYRQGTPMRDIAAQWGCSERTAMRRLKDAGVELTGNRKDQPTPDQAADLRGQGWSTRSIASEFDVSYQTVHNRLDMYDREQGIEREKRPSSRDELTEDAVRAEYVDLGKSDGQIAEDHGYSLYQVQLLLDLAGVDRRPRAKPVETDELRRLYEQEKLSASAIAQREDVPLSASQVLRRLNDAGVDTSYTPLTDPLLLVHLVYHRGLPATEAGRDARVQLAQRTVYENIGKAVDELGGILSPEDCRYCEA